HILLRKIRSNGLHSDNPNCAPSCRRSNRRPSGLTQSKDQPALVVQILRHQVPGLAGEVQGIQHQRLDSAAPQLTVRLLGPTV
ncbi:MAG: hypothetical protein QGD88_11180, partial [Anaerolineae bacterium]|nr:hypothetical protein [Anaerolineae bacterium]